MTLSAISREQTCSQNRGADILVCHDDHGRQECLPHRWLDRGILLAVLLAAGVALSLNVADPDLWGHVQYGRDAIAHGLPTTTTYSYVAQNYPWINHEIIAEYALAIIADSLGGPGLLIIKCLLGIAIIGAMLRRATRDGAGLVAACSFALLIAITLGNHWSLRPQIISYVSFTLLVAMLSYAFQGWEGRWQLLRHSNSPLEYSLPRLKVLWLAVPLFIIWTNSHGGFLAGLCVFLAYLGLRGIEAILRKGRHADGLIIRFALMGFAAIASTFINPYGHRFHLWLYDDLKVPRPEIVEWRAPELFDTQFLPFWLLLAAATAAIAFSRRSRDFTHVTILVLILWQALTHHRHIAFFAIACGWWLPLHWNSLLSRLGTGQFSSSEPYSATFAPRMQRPIALLLVFAICVCTGQLLNRVSTLKVERENYPVSAFEFIANKKLTGKMVCTFNWAQYALDAFGPLEPGQPGILVQVDGRCRTSYPQAMLDMHFDFLFGQVDPSQRYRDPNSGPFDPQRVLNFERPDLVLISRHQQPSVEVMQRQSSRWALLYQDSLAQLWGRSSRYDDATSAYFLPPNDRSITDQPQTGFKPWPALPDYRPNSSAVGEVAMKSH